MKPSFQKREKKINQNCNPLQGHQTLNQPPIYSGSSTHSCCVAKCVQISVSVLWHDSNKRRQCHHSWFDCGESGFRRRLQTQIKVYECTDCRVPFNSSVVLLQKSISYNNLWQKQLLPFTCNSSRQTCCWRTSQEHLQRTQSNGLKYDQSALVQTWHRFDKRSRNSRMYCCVEQELADYRITIFSSVKTVVYQGSK